VVEPADGRAQHRGEVCELLQEAYLPAGRRDGHVVARRHLLVHELQYRPARALEALGGEVQVVHEKDDRAPARDRPRGVCRAAARGRAGASVAARDRPLFPPGARRDPLEGGELDRLPVHAQLELFGLEPFDEPALLVEDRDGRLHKLGADADDLVPLSVRGRPLLPRRRPQRPQAKQRQPHRAPRQAVRISHHW
jgi:hypothetical protein